MKQEWIEALRSGKYTQDYGTLKSAKGHCCLGVLCEIHPKVQEYYHSFIYDGQLMRKLLSDKLLASIEGLTKAKMETLSAMNDSLISCLRPIDFNEIADWIEKNV